MKTWKFILIFYFCAIVLFGILILVDYKKVSKIDGEVLSTSFKTVCKTDSDNETFCDTTYGFNYEEKEYTCTKRIYVTTNEYETENKMIYFEKSNPKNCKVEDKTWDTRLYIFMIIFSTVVAAIFLIIQFIKERKKQTV